MAELDERDAAVVIDILTEKQAEAKAVNEKYIAAGWNGQGSVGYYILRVGEILEKLRG